jgi:hypothetical protein
MITSVREKRMLGDKKKKTRRRVLDTNTEIRIDK